MTDVIKNIEQSLDVLYKLEDQTPKKNLLLGKGKTIYLQIGLFRVPFVVTPVKKYLKLKHSLYGDDPEICLFVPNRKSGVTYKITTDEFIDFCVDYYTEFLKKHKIKGITTIMPLKQLRSEYGPYEMRRKLVRRYDLFLCKNSLLYNHRFVSVLGKIFRDASREPLGVAFPKHDSPFDPEFQKNIERAILTSSFVIKRSSDNYTIPIGSLSHSKTQLKENLETALEQLLSENMIPGGLSNVRVIYLWPSQSKPIPLFINPELPPKDKKPRVMKGRKRKRAIGAVEGEISTQPGKKVVVMPNGEVFVTNLENEEAEPDSVSEDSFKDESEEEEEVVERNDYEEVQTKGQGDEDESESEDDDEIEEREQRLLTEKREAEEEEEASKKAEDEVEEEPALKGNSEDRKKKKAAKKKREVMKKSKTQKKSFVKKEKGKVKKTKEMRKSKQKKG